MKALSTTVSVDSDRTELVILGTLHGFHNENSKYSKETLRDIIVTLKPAAILFELPPTIFGKATVKDGRISQWLVSNKDGSVDPEGWAANTAADLLSVPVIPYDREGRNEFYQETNYHERAKQAGQKLETWLRGIREDHPESAEVLVLGDLYSNIAQSQLSLIQNATPEVLNSEAYDMLIQSKRCIDSKLRINMLREHGEQEALVQEFVFFRDKWNERNRVMAENVVDIAYRYSGKRLVVLAGGEHRCILRNLLSQEPSIVLLEFWELVNVKQDGSK